MVSLTSSKYYTVVIVSISLLNFVSRLSVFLCAPAVIKKSIKEIIMSTTSTSASAQQTEIEETIKRIQTHKGVQGFILTSNDGNRNQRCFTIK